MSLTVLKGLGYLAHKVPYLSPAAGLVLDALKMRDVCLSPPSLAISGPHKREYRRSNS